MTTADHCGIYLDTCIVQHCVQSQACSAERQVMEGESVAQCGAVTPVGVTPLTAAAADQQIRGMVRTVTTQTGLLASLTATGVAYRHLCGPLCTPARVSHSVSVSRAANGMTDEQIPATDMRHPSALSQLRTAVESTSSFTLQPRAFFIAWQGVLTLVYDAWPAAACRLKGAIDTMTTADAGSLWKPENSGSKFPKTSLACLQDGKELTLEQLSQLQALCDKFSARLSALQAVSVNSLEFVRFNNRALTDTSRVIDIPLDSSSPSQLTYSKDVEAVVQQSTAHVNKVLAECTTETLSTYIDLVNRAGGRQTHYSAPHVEDTLVATLFAQQLNGSAPIDDEAARQLLSVYNQFVDDVKQLLPNCYHFFPTSSLHVTIRHLNAETT